MCSSRKCVYQIYINTLEWLLMEEKRNEVGIRMKEEEINKREHEFTFECSKGYDTEYVFRKLKGQGTVSYLIFKNKVF